MSVITIHVLAILIVLITMVAIHVVVGQDMLTQGLNVKVNYVW